MKKYMTLVLLLSCCGGSYLQGAEMSEADKETQRQEMEDDDAFYRWDGKRQDFCRHLTDKLNFEGEQRRFELVDGSRLRKVAMFKLKNHVYRAGGSSFKLGCPLSSEDETRCEDASNRQVFSLSELVGHVAGCSVKDKDSHVSVVGPKVVISFTENKLERLREELSTRDKVAQMALVTYTEN